MEFSLDERELLSYLDHVQEEKRAIEGLMDEVQRLLDLDPSLEERKTILSEAEALVQSNRMKAEAIAQILDVLRAYRRRQTAVVEEAKGMADRLDY